MSRSPPRTILPSPNLLVLLPKSICSTAARHPLASQRGVATATLLENLYPSFPQVPLALAACWPGNIVDTGQAVGATFGRKMTRTVQFPSLCCLACLRFCCPSLFVVSYLCNTHCLFSRWSSRPFASRACRCIAHAVLDKMPHRDGNCCACCIRWK